MNVQEQLFLSCCLFLICKFLKGKLNKLLMFEDTH